MSDCCSSQNNDDTSSISHTARKRYQCPLNNKEYQQVSYDTVIQHIKKPWDSNLLEQQYYFCTDPECEVVYFGEDDKTIKQAEMRTKVGIKTSEDVNSLICYCFDISKAEARLNKDLKQFVTDLTKKKYCSCESKNPSGRCCLKDFKKLGY